MIFLVEKQDLQYGFQQSKPDKIEKERGFKYQLKNLVELSLNHFMTHYDPGMIHLGQNNCLSIQ